MLENKGGVLKPALKVPEARIFYNRLNSRDMPE